MSEKLRIGTRESQLAIWQAEHIRKKLNEIGISTELVFIKSDGELDLSTPLYEMGVQGIFTKMLDVALLQDKIDVAVHSLKDVPTQTAKGVKLVATPERGDHRDVLIYKDILPELSIPYTIATSSLRRKAQWLNRYPKSAIENLRGNINTRLQKLLNNAAWHGAVFASAGIERINLDVPNKQLLDWMLPAPAQGALGVACREDDTATIELCSQLSHLPTWITTSAERMFLRTLMGGCSMPIGAYAYLKNNMMYFKGNVLSTDGREKVEVEMTFEDFKNSNSGAVAAQHLLEKGGKKLIDQLKEQLEETPE